MRRLLERVVWEERGAGSRSVIVGTMIAASIFIGAYAATQGGGGEPGDANLWVDTNGTGDCTRLDPAGEFDDSKSCQDLGEAYQAMQCGDTTLVRAGTYGDQRIIESAVSESCTSNRMTMEAEDGATPSFHFIGTSTADGDNTGPDNVTLRGFIVVWGISIRADANNVTLDDFDGGSVVIGTSDSGAANGWIPTGVIVQNSDWGPCNTGGEDRDGEPADCRATEGQQSSPAEGKNKLYNSEDILLYNNVFHDYRMTTEDHFECWWIAATNTDITFRHNKFYNCETNDVALPCTTNEGTWIIENNWFGANNPGNAGFRWCTKDGNPGPATFIMRYNTFSTDGGWGTEDLPTGSLGSNVYFIGNLFGEQRECPDVNPATQMLYNTYLNDSPCTGETGGATYSGDPFVDNAGAFGSDGVFNLHLSSGFKTNIENRVPADVGPTVDGAPAGNLTTDWDSDTRPCPSDGGNRDVGADERCGT